MVMDGAGNNHSKRVNLDPENSTLHVLSLKTREKQYILGKVKGYSNLPYRINIKMKCEIH